MERRLAAIFAADVVGYARLIRADEEGTLAAVQVLQRELVGPMISARGGRVFKLMGDGLLAEFPSVVDAVRVALELQRVLAERNADAPAPARIDFRVGINLGDIVVDGDDIQGDGVNVAARLEGLAPPGGICISRAVHDQLKGKLDTPLTPLGLTAIKNIPEPVEVWRVETGTAAVVPNRTDPTERPSVAVLPFDNMSAAADQEFLADGIVEDLITELSRFRWLLVIARNSTYAYKGSRKDIRQIGRELGVRYVVEGSVRRAGDRLRVTVQLVEAETGAHIWAERYDRVMDDIFALQDEVTGAVVSAIEPELGAHERGLARRKPTNSLTAWELYQRGVNEYLSMEETGHAKSIDYFQAAIDKDPDFALAHAGLARSLGIQLVLGNAPDRDAALASGMALAKTALDLDPRCDDAYRSLGLLLVLSRRVGDALETLNRGLALNPNSAALYLNRAQAYVMDRQFDAAIADARTAKRLNPYHPLVWIYHVVCAIALMCRNAEGDEDSALIELEAACAERNSGWPCFFNMAVLKARRGFEAEARELIRRALEAKPDLTLAVARSSLPLPHPPQGIWAAVDALVPLGLPRV